MATVYLHIGLPKTATSSLQYFLNEEENRKILKEHGICYPDTGCRYKQVSNRRNAHFLVAFGNEFTDHKNKDQLHEVYENGLDALAELAEHYEKIILSDESIWKRGYTRKAFWPKLKEDLAKRNLDIRIIVYFRRQDLWLESYYAQKIRAGKFSDTINAFIDFLKSNDYPLDFYHYLNELSALYGKEKLLIRVFEEAQFHGNEKTIYSDFLDIFGLPLNHDFKIRQERYNARYEGDLLECRRILNSLPEYQTAFHPMRDSFNLLRDMRSINSGEQFFYLEPQQREQFLSSFTESNERLAEEYLGRQDGVLFYETPGELPIYQVNQYELTRSVALVCAKKISDMEIRNEKMERELNRLYEGLLSTRVKKTVKHLLIRKE